MPNHPVLTPIRQRLKKPQTTNTHGVSSDTFSDKALTEAGAGDTVVTMQGCCQHVPTWPAGTLVSEMLRGYTVRTRR